MIKWWGKNKIFSGWGIVEYALFIYYYCKITNRTEEKIHV